MHAGVTRIDRSVGLNRAFNLWIVLRANWPLESADNSGRQGSIEPERISDRQNFLSHDQLVRIAERHDRDRFLRRLQQSNHRKIGVRIFSDDAGGVILAVAETNGKLLGI